MTEKFILWAQALDNLSPDHFDVQSEELAVDDSVRRQAAVSSVSGVIKRGSRVYEASGVLLTADNRYFVLEVPSNQLDRAGRAAPIVCHGEYETGVDTDLGETAAVALDDFAKRIGRTLRPDHFELVRAAFAALKKKRIPSTGLLNTLAIIVLSLLLLGIFWLTKRDR